MTRADYKATSHYSRTPQTEWYLSYYEHISIEPSPSDTIYTIPARYDKRPDFAAAEIYGDPKLWQFIYKRNLDRLEDPFEDFVTGLQIYLPAKQRVLSRAS